MKRKLFIAVFALALTPSLAFARTSIADLQAQINDLQQQINSLSLQSGGVSASGWVTVESNRVVVTPGSESTVTVQCPGTTVPVGGGASYERAWGGGTPVIAASLPFGPGPSGWGWEAKVGNLDDPQSPSSTPIFAFAVAVCLKAAP